MKTCLAVFAMVLSLASLAPAQQPGTPTRLGVPAELKKYNITIRRFDPHQGYDSGENFVLPVDSIDEDHAIASRSPTRSRGRPRRGAARCSRWRSAASLLKSGSDAAG